MRDIKAIRNRDAAWGGGYFRSPDRFVETAQDRRDLLDVLDSALVVIEAARGIRLGAYSGEGELSVTQESYEAFMQTLRDFDA